MQIALRQPAITVCTLLAMLALSVTEPARADSSEPLGNLQPGEISRLEVGAGLASLTRPDYRGSAETDTLVLPVPYVSYESRNLLLSRDGLVAKLFDSEHVQLRISGYGTFPGDGSQDKLRSGMPELLPTFEIGPSLDWELLSHANGSRLELRLPVRAAIATDLDRTQGIGVVAHPNLRYERDTHWGAGKLTLSAAAGPMWATKKYHEYYYEVAPRFATANRPAYRAEGGYSGTRLATSISFKHGPWLLGMSLTHDRLEATEFESSPLVETNNSTIFSVGVFYTFWTWIKRDPSEV